ncbi:O-antigen ligase family protein [Duganella hordei]|uniref:O-antigen ligase family protein n=1 Tax=Duganella hordei TaxID=2865934 RepID=UPI0030EA6463
MNTLRSYSVGFSSALGSLFSRARLKALLVFWLPVFLVSAFLGLCCVMLPWWLNLGMAAAVAYVCMLWIWPWVGFGVYVLIAIVAPDFKLADAATVGTMMVLAFRIWSTRQMAPPLPSRLSTVMWVFAIIVAVSFGMAIFYFHNKVPNIYRDGRAFLYWLWLPILWRMTAGQQDSIPKLVRVIVGIALTVVGLALFQWVTGVQVVAVGLVASLGTTSGLGEEVTRVQMPGFLFVSWAVIWLMLQMLYKRVSLLVAGPMMLLLLAGLYVNFGRGLWAWTFIGILIPVFFIGSGRSAKLLIMMTLGAVLGVGTLAVVKPSVLENIGSRLISVQNEGGQKSSYGWRELENTEALITLRRTPLVGVGMGGEYRPWVHELRLFFEHVRYIHNSYLFIALKLGIPGLLCLLILYWRSWNGARQGLSVISDQYRVTLLACLSFFPISMGLSITQPEFMNTYSVLIFVFMIVIFANCFVPEARAAKPRHLGGVC